MPLSDYRQMEKELIELGGKRVGQIGVLGGARYEGWLINGRGFLLATKDGAVEIYVCGSPSTAGLEKQIEFMRSFAAAGSEGRESETLSADDMFVVVNALSLAKNEWGILSDLELQDLAERAEALEARLKQGLKGSGDSEG